MTIARLIAEQPDWETRLGKLLEALSHSSPGNGAAERTICDVSGRRVVELQCGGPTDPAHVNRMVAEYFPGCDALIAEGEITMPALFVSDMDSTMIEQECIDELADYAGLKEQIAQITERAMQGELDFGDALRERVGLLKGLDEAAIEQCLAERISPMPGAKTLVATLKAHGCRCVLVTGGFHHFGDRVAHDLGFDRVVGNRLGVADGKLTGLLAGPISDASTKLSVLREEAAVLGQGARVLSSGDGANDIPILEAADYGFAYRAKPAARSAANGRIDAGDLTHILDLLGVPRDRWVTG